MKILVLGAGAVGQVFATHLRRSGAYVALYVKPKHAEACQRGLTLYSHRLFRRHTVETLHPDDVYTTLDEVAGQRWDQVWLCVSTAALEGEWLDPLLEAIGDATLVCPQPGLHVLERVSHIVPPQQVVSGTIGFMSYQAPLPGEALDPGVAYLFPPLGASRFSGHPDRVDPVVAALRRGGCPARVVRDARATLAYSSAFLLPHVAALEGAGWTFEDLRHGPWLRLASRACAEAMRVVRTELGVRLPWYRIFAQPTLVRIATLVLPILLPFDVERFARYHFTKIGDQNRLVMQGLYEGARQHGIEAPGLTELYERVYG
ncbi:MAG: 2-dehydropantoate 2-reductase N-terminal domain-containing protein [Polyangiales bacterium]